MTDGISFIVINYNKERYIAKTLRSVIDQQGDYNKEIIFLDNKSTDQSLSIAKNILATVSSGRVLALQEDYGPAISWNIGAMEAKYPYVFFLDADDFVTLNAGHNLLMAMKKYRADMITGTMPGEDDDHSQRVMSLDSPDLTISKPTFETVLKKGACANSGTLVKKSTFLSIGGCDTTLFIQESSIALRMSLNHIFIQSNLWTGCRPKNYLSKNAAFEHLVANRPQIFHDYNACLYGLLRDYTYLDNAIKKRILKKAASRAWHWAKRIEKKKPLLCKEFYLYICSCLPIVLPYLSLTKNCLPIFNNRKNSLFIPNTSANSWQFREERTHAEQV